MPKLEREVLRIFFRTELPMQDRLWTVDNLIRLVKREANKQKNSNKQKDKANA